MSSFPSFSNDTGLHSRLLSNNSELPLYTYCYNGVSFISFCLTKILLLLPLCISVLYLGLQQWWQKRSSASAASVSHSDSFTYHMVVMELIGVFGCFLTCCGIFSEHFNILVVGFHLISFTWIGEIFFNVLTCVERYLAVIHPITYLGLRNARGIRIQNCSIGCVWLLCLVGVFSMRTRLAYAIINFCFSAPSLIIVSLGSFSILCALMRPRPGDQPADRERVDQSKRKAFYTIVAILGVLAVRFVLGVVWAVLDTSGGLKNCVMMTCDVWFNLPSSLVLPVLFLHKTGKLACCEQTTKRVTEK